MVGERTLVVGTDGLKIALAPQILENFSFLPLSSIHSDRRTRSDGGDSFFFTPNHSWIWIFSNCHFQPFLRREKFAIFALALFILSPFWAIRMLHQSLYPRLVLSTFKRKPSFSPSRTLSDCPPLPGVNPFWIYNRYSYVCTIDRSIDSQ